LWSKSTTAPIHDQQRLPAISIERDAVAVDSFHRKVAEVHQRSISTGARQSVSTLTRCGNQLLKSAPGSGNKHDRRERIRVEADLPAELRNRRRVEEHKIRLTHPSRLADATLRQAARQESGLETGGLAAASIAS
jgi:hypothetical protein